MREPEQREIDRRHFLRRLDALVGVYTAAMAPPTDQLPGRRTIMERHSTYPSFRSLIVEHQRTIVAFAYGFHGMPGQWWHDVVAGALTEEGGIEHARKWLADPFEVAEVHVLPAYQGRGIGRRMLTTLCDGRKETTMVLSTLDMNSRARHLYRSLGLTDLLTAFYFPGGGPAYAVMGSTLPLTSSRP